MLDKEGIDNFALTDEETKFVIPILKEILAVNPTLKIMGTPWTAPRWMKVNNLKELQPYNSWKSGQLNPKYYADYGEYFAKWIKAFADNGIKIYSVTPQNEPLNRGNSASMYMGWEEERDFVKNGLGPALKKAGLDTKIFAFDHNYNYDNISSQQSYPTKIYADEEASGYLDGAAFHNYGGNKDELTVVHKATPGMDLVFTETSIGTWNDGRNLDKRLSDDMEQVALGTVNRWCKGVIVWNLMLDEDKGPNRPGGCQTCYGAVDINRDYTKLTRNSHYYIIAHMSSVVRPDAVRIGTRGYTAPGLTYSAFRNPDSSYAVVISNSSHSELHPVFDDGNHRFTVSVPARSAVSLSYLPAFKAAATEGGAWSFMGGYNLFRGEHASYNPILMNDILKGEWGWDGAVISDWGAVHDTRTAVSGGLDMEFGSWTNGLTNGKSNAYDSYFLADPYLKGIQDGTYSANELNDKVRRVLRLTFRTVMDRNRPFGALNSDEHSEACRTIGEEGIVLLQNRGNVLPIDLTKTRRIAVIGENAIKMMTVGGGSSSLKVRYEVTPLDGLKNRIGDKAMIVYARGYVGDPTGEYNGVVTGQDLSDSRSPEELRAEALDVARNADIVLFFGGLNKSNHQDCEDTDRESLDLPYGQSDLIEAIAKVNPNMAVINISGTGVAMPWTDKVPAILQAWYLGNETGNAIASVLMGEVNPSGKLPYTYYASLDQCGAHKLNGYPGHPAIDALGNEVMDVPYNEGIYVGYRFIDKNKLKPTFPFGHGLSYTQFEYGKASIDRKMGSADEKFIVSVPVTNVGPLAGKEIVQLYISDH